MTSSLSRTPRSRGSAHLPAASVHAAPAPAAPALADFDAPRSTFSQPSSAASTFGASSSSDPPAASDLAASPPASTATSTIALGSLAVEHRRGSPARAEAEVRFCEVCWQVTADPVGCDGCTHRYCTDCLCRYWTAEIFSGRHRRIQCMYGLCCAQMATDADIARVVEPRTYRKLLYFRARDELAGIDNVTFCTREMCWRPIVPTKDALRRRDPVTFSVCVQCEQCGTRVCLECGQPWHAGEKCPRVNQRGRARALASRAWTRVHTKPCPACKVRIQKDQGCAHMNCTRCNASFCWRCGGYILNGARAQGRPCRCESVMAGLMYAGIAAVTVLGSPVILAVAVVGGPPYCAYRVYRRHKERELERQKSAEQASDAASRMSTVREASLERADTVIVNHSRCLFDRASL